MKRRRISSALVGLVASVAVCAALWPHARDAGAIVLAQDDPAELADVQISAALRKNQALVSEQIEAALAAGDADLAGSFAALAREKNIPLADELSRRVADAVTEENSSAHFARRLTISRPDLVRTFTPRLRLHRLEDANGGLISDPYTIRMKSG